MDKNNLSPSKGCISFWLSFLAGNLFQFLVLCIIISVFQSQGLNASTDSLLQNIYVNLFIYLGLYIGMLFVFLFYSKPKPKIFKKTSWLKILIYTAISVATFFMLNPIISCISNWLVNAGFTPNLITFKLTIPNYFIAIIFLVILPATVEELIFRGIIFSSMSKQGKTFATITTTLIFSLFHSSIFQTLYPILFGFLLCVIMLREENIYYCMIAHAANNLLALTSQFFGWNLFSNSVWFTLLAFALALIYLSVTILAFIKTKQKDFQQKQSLTIKDKILLTSTFVILIIIWICSSFLA